MTNKRNRAILIREPGTWRDCFLSIESDGTGMNKYNSSGIGRVVCNVIFLTPNAVFEVDDQPDGAVTIGSTVFPNVFLRMGPDGTVNAQYGAGPHEKFRINKYGEDHGQDLVRIELQASPGMFLTFGYLEANSPPYLYRGEPNTRVSGCHLLAT